MNGKNILFIGDLRSAHNYGAIATTETLIKLLDDNVKATYKYIDAWSFRNTTPVEAFGDTWRPSRKNNSLLRRAFRRFYSYVGKNETLTKIPDRIPYKLSQFESYYNNLIKGDSLQYEKKMLDWADIVFINGEGNIVNGTDKYGKYRIGGRYILFMAWLSKCKFHRPTLIVNHTVDPNNYNAFEMIKAIYPSLDEVLVRETLSIGLLKSIGVNNARFVPDALFAYQPQTEWTPSVEISKQIDFSQPYICIGDSSGIKNGYGSVKWDVYDVYDKIIDELKKIVPQVVFVDGFTETHPIINMIVKKKNIGRVNLRNCSYHDLYYVFKNAKIFVSGRWHASILCVLANTPILLWGADSHKTRSLYTLLDYSYRFFEISSLPANIPELVQEVKLILGKKDIIKKELKEKVAIYSVLAKENAKILKEYVEE